LNDKANPLVSTSRRDLLPGRAVYDISVARRAGTAQEYSVADAATNGTGFFYKPPGGVDFVQAPPHEGVSLKPGTVIRTWEPSKSKFVEFTLPPLPPAP
jgi:hypothetical protein